MRILLSRVSFKNSLENTLQLRLQLTNVQRFPCNWTLQVNQNLNWGNNYEVSPIE